MNTGEMGQGGTEEWELFVASGAAGRYCVIYVPSVASVVKAWRSSLGQHRVENENMWKQNEET